jgi:hypothetical protein
LWLGKAKATREAARLITNGLIGDLYSFYFSRDAASRSTDVQVQIAYNPAPGGVAFATTSRLFLIAEHTRTCEITTSQGLVTAVRALNV